MNYQKIQPKMLLFIRFSLAILFIVSGSEKLLSPYQNFLNVIVQYKILNSFPLLEKMAAIIMPWIELFLGVFLLIGLWIRYVLYGYCLLFITFLTIVSQAIIRKLPLDECGCFGDMLSFSLPHLILFDSMMLILVFLLLRNLEVITKYSIDGKTE